MNETDLWTLAVIVGLAVVTVVEIGRASCRERVYSKV